MPQAGIYRPGMTMGGAANRGNLPSQPSQPSRPSQPSSVSALLADSALAQATQSEYRTERD
jgi:hypothetical protein